MLASLIADADAVPTLDNIICLLPALLDLGPLHAVAGAFRGAQRTGRAGPFSGGPFAWYFGCIYPGGIGAGVRRAQGAGRALRHAGEPAPRKS